MIDVFHVGLYLLGVAMLAVTYLPFSPATVDLVFYSREKQIALFERRWLLRGVGILSLLVLFVSALIDGQFGWIGLLGATTLVSVVAFWIGYVPSVMSPPKERTVLSAAEGDELLAPDETVLGLYHDGEARAYPRKHIARPHYLPDVVQGDSLVVTYCVLCNSGVAFHAELDGEPMDILPITAPDNNILLLDRTTGNYIQQLEARVVAGPDEGTRLESIPVQISEWGEWKRLHSETTLVSAPPQSIRDRIVAVMLDMMVAIPKLEARETPFHDLTTAVDDRLPAMSYILGIERDGERLAVPRAALDERPVVNETVGGTAIAILYDSDREIGNVFYREVGEHVLTFRPAPDGPHEAVARDDETGTYWTLSGEAIAGELAGRTLDQHPHWDDLFWFSWAAFRPDTRVFTSVATSTG
jgi:uncharacterized membrane protein YtjA (UPF0391 family)